MAMSLVQTRPTAASSRSMSLMPMNGTISAAQAVDQQVAAQQRGGADGAVAHALQRQRDQEDDDQRVEDHRRQDRRRRARQPHHVERAAAAGRSSTKAAGMMAKYLATSLAIEKVVSEPRVISSCLPVSTTSISLVGLRVEVDHVAGLLGRLRAGVHRHRHVGLRQRRRVVGAVAGHRHQPALGLVLADQRAACPRAWPRRGSRRRRPRPRSPRR